MESTRGLDRPLCENTIHFDLNRHLNLCVIIVRESLGYHQDVRFFVEGA